MRKGFARYLVLMSLLAAVPGLTFAQGPNPHAKQKDLKVKKAVPRASWDFEAFSKIPVLSGGRIKPLSTFAEEVVLYITGRRGYKGDGSSWRNAELLLSWVTQANYWYGQPIFKVGHVDTRQQLLLDRDRTHFTPRELYSNTTVVQYLQSQENQAPAPDDRKLPAREQDLKRVLQGMFLFDRLVSGEAWAVVPRPEPEAWDTLARLGEKDSHGIRPHFAELIRAYMEKDEEAFTAGAQNTKAAVEKAVASFGTSTDSLQKKIAIEFHYNELRPFRWAWILLVLSALLWIWVCIKPATPMKVLAFSASVAGVLFNIYGFALRVIIAGRPPVSNMYETVVWVAFGIMVFGFIIYALHRQSLIMAVATTLSGFFLIMSDFAPAVLDPMIHPLVPVLRSNLWLLIHVLTITISYAAFALSLGIGNVALFHYILGEARPGVRQKISNLNQLAYRAMQFGVVLVAAGTILGGVWADYSWGRFWGWDPKEVWALIVLLVYVIIIHGRFAGWVGAFGFAAWNVVAFSSVVMAWYGVNFVLGAGLHSYGFSTGGTPTVMTMVGLQIFYVLIAVYRHRFPAGSSASK